MFYSTDILTRKRSGMGVVWLAATLGTHNRRLTKRDYNTVNVVEACEFLVSPPEPLALRLSSNLMVGVTRVYRQQYIFYFNDVNNVFTNLRQHLVAGPRLEVEMEQPEQRHDAITLPEMSDSLAQEWNFMSQNTNRDLLVQFGWIVDENHPDLTCVPADSISLNTSLYSQHERALMDADKTLLSVSDSVIAKRSTAGSIIFPTDHSSTSFNGIGSQVGFVADLQQNDLFGEDFGRILNDVRMDHHRVGSSSVLGSETSFAFNDMGAQDGSSRIMTDTQSLADNVHVKEVQQRAQRGVKRRRKEPVAQADDRIEYHANALFVLHGDAAVNEHYLALSSDQENDKPDSIRQEIRYLMQNPLADMCESNFNEWPSWTTVKIDIGQLDISFKVEKKRRIGKNDQDQNVDVPETAMAFDAEISFDSITGNIEQNSSGFLLPDEVEVGRDAQTPRVQRPSLPWKNFGFLSC